MRPLRHRAQVPDSQRVREPDGLGMPANRAHAAGAAVPLALHDRSRRSRGGLPGCRVDRPRRPARIRGRFLSHGMKQALELAMVLALEPSVLLLDEPTAGLTKPERKLIGDILVELAARHGLCILLIEHDLDFVRDISSRVIVLHQGRIALDGTVREVVESELVRTIYTGAAHTGLEGRP